MQRRTRARGGGASARMRGRRRGDRREGGREGETDGARDDAVASDDGDPTRPDPTRPVRRGETTTSSGHGIISDIDQTSKIMKFKFII